MISISHTNPNLVRIQGDVVNNSDDYIEHYSDAAEIMDDGAQLLSAKADASFDISGCTLTLKRRVNGKILIPSVFNDTPVIAIQLNN